MIFDIKSGKPVCFDSLADELLPTPSAHGQIEQLESRIATLEHFVRTLLPVFGDDGHNKVFKEERFIDTKQIKRVIIAGSRTAESMTILRKALRECGWKPKVILSGRAPGADRLGERYANAEGLELEEYPADWNRLKKRAGMVRNAEMVKHADGLIALWDGKSPGTRHVIACAHARGIPTYVYVFDPADFLT
jgi:glycerophosphoryl diester phosphodiesterase